MLFKRIAIWKVTKPEEQVIFIWIIQMKINRHSVGMTCLTSLQQWAFRYYQKCENMTINALKKSVGASVYRKCVLFCFNSYIEQFIYIYIFGMWLELITKSLFVFWEEPFGPNPQKNKYQQPQNSFDLWNEDNTAYTVLCFTFMLCVYKKTL